MGADLPGNLQVHGFGSQAFIVTSDNDFFGDSHDGGSFDFRELGLNASLRPLPRFQLSAQILSRRAGASDDGDLDLDYAFADYSVISSAVNLAGVRAGRVKNPLALYNDTRDVAFTRPSILLPQSIYVDRSRDLALSSDGVQLYGEHRMDAGVIGVQLNVGSPRVSGEENELVFLGGSLPGELDADTSYFGRILYERDGGRLRLALSAAQLNVNYRPAAVAGDFDAGTVRFEPLIFSAQYNAERWSLTGEYSRRRSRFEGLGPLFPDLTFTGEAYYLQGTYRFAQDWDALLRYDVSYADKDDRDGDEFHRVTGRPAHNRFAKDLTLGLSWYIGSSFLLRAEFHNVDGTDWLPLSDNPDFQAQERYWQMYLLQGSFRF